MTQGRKSEPSQNGRAEGSSARSEQREDSGTHERSRAEGQRDSSKGQTVGQGRSGRDSEGDDARRSEDSSKEQRGAGKERAQHQGRKDKGQTVGQSKSERDNAQRSEDRTQDKGKSDAKADSKADNKSNSQQNGSGIKGQSAQDRNSNSGVNQNAAQGETNTQGHTQSQTTAGLKTQSGKNVTAQQQTTLQTSVLHASNAPHVDVNSINFQVRSGISVPSSVHIASVSTYPALIDVFPAYRDDSFFVVEDEVVIVDRDRRIVDVVPVGPRARLAGGTSSDHGSGHVAAVDLPPDDIRLIQRVLIDRGLLHGDADGVWGPETREAITTYQRQQGIAVTGGIDMRTVSSLGVSGRLSQQARESIQSQSSSNDAQTSTGAKTTTGQGQGQSGQMNQPLNQQNATGNTPNQNSGQAQNPEAQNPMSSSSTTRQGMPNRSNTTGQAHETSQSGSSSTANQPSANQSTPSGSSLGSRDPAQRSGPNH
jgi:hypothetical protein